MKAMTSKRIVFNNDVSLLSATMRGGARSHAKDYVTSLDNQSEQFL